MGWIVCRACCSPNCFDGDSADRVYEDGDMGSDGTFDGESVICDACYVTLGCPVIALDGGIVDVG